MTQIIRKFDNANTAKAATDELRQRGFGTIETVDIPAGRRGNGGGAVVRVEAPFGTAMSATTILDRHGGRDASGEARPVTNPANGSPSATRPSGASAPSDSSGRPAVEPAPASGANRHANARHHQSQHGSHEDLRGGPRTLSAWLGIPELISSNTFFSVFPLLIRPEPVTGATRSGDQTRDSEDRSRSALVRGSSAKSGATTEPAPILIGAQQSGGTVR
jgi:hypothetical protein